MKIIWRHIKHVKDPQLLKQPNVQGQLPSHVCIQSWKRLRLTRNKKRKDAFVTIAGMELMHTVHKETKEAIASLNRVGLKSTATTALAVEGLNNFVVSPAELDISQVARYYIYGKARVSKEIFDDPEFRGLLQSSCVAVGGKGKAPFLMRQGLLAFVEAEDNICKCFAQATLKHVLESSDGNAPMQGLHDCVTLKNHKCLAAGVEFDVNKNQVVAVTLVPISGGTDVMVAPKLDKVFEDVLGVKYHEVSSSTIPDQAAAGVASQFGQEDDTCDVHDTDKFGRAMSGGLTRSKSTDGEAEGGGT